MQLKLSPLILFSLLLVMASCDVQDEGKFIDEEFPNFNAKLLMGDSVKVMPYGVGKPTLVNVWATWCAPCVREIPALEELAATGDFYVIALSTDANSAKVKEFVKKSKLEYTNVLFDAFGRGSRKYLDAAGLPVTFLVDRDRVVQEVYVGEKDWMDENFLKGLYKKSGVVLND